ncbi:bile acid:sodium symporter family protein [Mesobacillus maritimus]|uniref:bile acid:sodium symporter family protein n=1 Tax=Mesobacillus maritimus TaxID=1643336 RepID=UPI00203F3781|nr:bile acid:sodium symporter family protein [Mesobacillus maritimus]MCM3670409.1 bile acid:sodium symporter family protein [Mesobacillus maritimus]
MLTTINNQLEKFMPLITPTSVVIGVIFAEYFIGFSGLIPWIFAFMTFAGSLGSNYSSFKESLKHPLPLLIIFVVLHLFMPVWAWGVGHLTFSGDAEIITGLVLGMAIPTGISSLIWVTIYRGNIPLTLSIILLDTFLSPFIVPFTLSLLIGSKVEMDVLSIMNGLLWMIVLPSIAGMIVNQLTKGKAKTTLSPKLAPFSKMGLGIVVMINGATVAPFLRNIDVKLIFITLTVFFIAFTGYLLAFIIGRGFKWARETVVALTFTGGMRNISAGAVLAIAYFPPAVAVPVVIAMLFQQVLASIYGMFVERYFNRQILANGHSIQN